jgi:hypothetical protein
LNLIGSLQKRAKWEEPRREEEEESSEEDAGGCDEEAEELMDSDRYDPVPESEYGEHTDGLGSW